MKFDKLKRALIGIAALVSSFTIFTYSVGMSNMVAEAADTSGCKMELTGNPCGGKGSCTCGGKDLSVLDVNQGDYPAGSLNANWVTKQLQ